MTEPLLSARKVSFSYGSGPRILHSVDFELGAGEAVGLVGESGSGKSTLGRLLAGAARPTAGALERDPGLGDSDVQVIFQDPYSALNPALSALAAVAEVFRVKGGRSRGEARRAAGELLAQIGIEGEATERRPRRLSGGQCQRVSIGRALAIEPAVLIADEPTSSLDVSVQAQILNLLKELQRERGLAMVLISHDLDVIRYMTDRTYVMHGGEIVEAGPTEDVYRQPSDRYTQRLLSGLTS
ncbi:MAG: ABC transporter ATP-binding protein [Actinobacteria bacterium]|nr:ABC transporter ATP-binding protein [Actinomycetota bacterium]